MNLATDLTGHLETELSLIGNEPRPSAAMSVVANRGGLWKAQRRGQGSLLIQQIHLHNCIAYDSECIYAGKYDEIDGD